MAISKTKDTLELERAIWNTTKKTGVFGCFEVTIGFRGGERVDYMTYDTNGIWRCYEIKVSKSDFYSSANLTFIGNYNYFVMPERLYEEVKKDIPEWVGVYADGVYSVKRAKRQELKVDEQILKDSMIRSLFREFEKQYDSKDITLIERKNRIIRNYRKERDFYRDQLYALQNELFNKLGSNWRTVLNDMKNIDYRNAGNTKDV